MKTMLSDLNNHLFAHLKRLDDEDIPSELIQQEIKCFDAKTSVFLCNNRFGQSPATFADGHG